MKFGVNHVAMVCTEDSHDKFYRATYIDFGISAMLITHYGKNGSTGIVKNDSSQNRMGLLSDFSDLIKEKQQPRSSGKYIKINSDCIAGEFDFRYFERLMQRLFSFNPTLLNTVVEIARRLEVQENPMLKGLSADFVIIDEIAAKTSTLKPSPPKPHSNPMRGSW